MKRKPRQSDESEMPAPQRNDLDLANVRDLILDSINEGVFTVDLDWKITFFNRAAERITGIRRKDAVGHRCSEVFKANICEGSCILKETMTTKNPSANAKVFIVDRSGIRIPIKVSAAILRDDEGKVRGGVETFQDLRQIEALHKKLTDKHTFGDIVGKSEPMVSLFDLLPRISDSDSTVLVQGPSGTGKELFARAIHELSPRRKKKFLAVNCGALPDSLLESELFGYKAGAFTDAKKDKLGRFALAEGGTLFLDEIGDISQAMQTRLLRVLQERTYEPLGSIETVPANVRVIAATNKNLQELMEQGGFREDLYYRINVIRIDIPPLAERREDIPLLIDHFLKGLVGIHGRDITGLSPQALMALMEHDFPGNVRELQNVLEHAIVLCQDGLIQLHHLPAYLRKRSAPEVQFGDGVHLKSAEKTLIHNALLKNSGNRALAAKDLGIDPSTLYRKIKRLDIDVPQTDGRGKRS